MSRTRPKRSWCWKLALQHSGRGRSPPRKGGGDHEDDDLEDGHVFLCDTFEDPEDYEAASEDDGAAKALRTEDKEGGHAYMFEDIYEIPFGDEHAEKELFVTQHLSPRERAIAGIRHRKRMGENTQKRLRRHVNSLAQVLMACSARGLVKWLGNPFKIIYVQCFSPPTTSRLRLLTKTFNAWSSLPGKRGCPPPLPGGNAECSNLVTSALVMISSRNTIGLRSWARSVRNSPRWSGWLRHALTGVGFPG